MPSASSPTFFGFYVGRGDARFRAENLALHRELVAAGIPHVFKLYAGAHGQRVWSTHARAWLGLALAHLTPATRADPPAGLVGFVPVAKGPAGGVVLRGGSQTAACVGTEDRALSICHPAFRPAATTR